MAVNTNPSSRRALLAAAAGGTVALVAESLARPLPVRAGSDGDVVLGGLNESPSTTVLKSGNPGEVLRVEGTAGDGVFAHSDSKCGLRAESKTHHGIEAHAFGSGVSFGVYGVSDHFIGLRGEGGQAGVHGSSDDGFGVAGISLGNVGVHGDGDKAGVFGGSGAGNGVQGHSATGNGVQGHSGTGWGVTGGSDGTEFGASGGVFGMSDRTVGVFGLSAQGIAVEGRSDHDPATGIGVKGFSGHGIGVNGETEGSFDFETNRDVVGVLGISRSVDGVGGNGIGVEGRSETGIGVLGSGQQGVHGASGSPGGTGVLAKSETGAALNAVAVYPEHGARAIVAEGPVEFSSAGRGIIARRATQARVVSPVALDAAVSKILVTLLANPAGQMASSLSHVEIHESHQAFTVVLTAPAARKVPFAYFVLD
jgi:hypothetical protein